MPLPGSPLAQVLEVGPAAGAVADLHFNFESAPLTQGLAGLGMSPKGGAAAYICHPRNLGKGIGCSLVGGFSHFYKRWPMCVSRGEKVLASVGI